MNKRETTGTDVSQLTEAEREDFEERAAIMEYCAGMKRPTAERWALNNVLEKRKRQPLDKR